MSRPGRCNARGAIEPGRSGLVAALVTAGVVIVGWTTRPLPAGHHTTSGVSGDSTRVIEFETDEGTWMNVDVSPDGGTILFDLLGDLYTLSIDGGEAVQITSGRSWDHMAAYSPDGTRIAFASDRDGVFNIWTMEVDGSGLEQVTSEESSPLRVPTWTPDGLSLLAIRGVPGSGRRTLVSIELESSEVNTLPTESGPSGPVVSPDGRAIYYAADSRFGTDVAVLDPSSGRSTRLTRSRGSWRTGGARPRVSPDGRLLAYARRHDGVTTLRLRDLSTGTERQLLSRVTDDAIDGYSPQDVLPAYDFTPNGREIVLTIDGKLHRVSVEDGTLRPIPFRAHVRQEIAVPTRPRFEVPDSAVEVRAIRWPDVSPDGRTLVFGALGQIWAMPIQGDTPRPLTSEEERAYYPTLSPDGTRLAYTTWSDSDLGHIWVMSLEGAGKRRLTELPGRYSNLAWSPDGSRIAFARGIGSERRREPLDFDRSFEVAWIAADSGEQHVIAIRPFRPFQYRTPFTIPTFSPDGSRVFYSEPTERGGRDRLVSVRLDGSDKLTHAEFFWLLDPLPSPDGRLIAFNRNGHVLVVPFPPAGDTVGVSFDGPEVLRLTDLGGTHPRWLSDGTLIWNSGAIVHHWSGTEAAAPTTLATVDLRVPRPVPSGEIAFTNARVVTMRGDEILEGATVVVRGERITAVGPAPEIAIPAGAIVVDASGKTIIPGLIDTHYHLAHPAVEREAVEEQSWQYLAQLAFGVTTVLDPSGTSNLDAFGAAEMLEAGALVGPRRVATGEPITGSEESYSGAITSSADVSRIVERYATYGAPMIKEYDLDRRDERRWLIRAAEDRELAVISHGNDLVGMLTRIIDGVWAIEHDLGVRIYDDVIQFIARAGGHYTPTLSTNSDLRPDVVEYFKSSTDYHDSPKLRRFVPEELLQQGRYGRRVPENEWYYRTLAEGAARISRAGGKISAGGHGEVQGIGTLWEIQALAEGGLSPIEAIRVATLTGAEKLGAESHLGSIEVGKLADFLILDANPLEDLQALHEQWVVVRGGTVYDSETLTELWPHERALGRRSWMTDDDARVALVPPKASIRR